MNIQRHGLSIGMDRHEDHFFLALKAQGKLTHEDYEVITPMIDSALAGVNEPKIRAIIDGTQMEGWEPRAAWDDFKLALKHGSEFEKIAIYGSKDWQEIAAKVGSWFIGGELRYFDDETQALGWLCE